MTTMRPLPSELEIGPASGLTIPFRELWSYRELTYFLVWRDVKVRYKQTALGAIWAILQPLAFMAVFTVVFGHLAKVNTSGMSYPIFALTGLVPWTFFAQALTSSSTSLVDNANLISKVYFPRLIAPLASAVAPIVDYAIALALLLVMMPLFGARPRLSMLAIPFITGFALLVAVAVGIWLAALNVRYRDVRYAVPFIVQIWLFISPVAYGTEAVAGRWHVLYALNPMTGVIEAFRWAVLGSHQSLGPLIIPSAAMTLIVLWGGLAYFHRVERTFADVI